MNAQRLPFTEKHTIFSLALKNPKGSPFKGTTIIANVAAGKGNLVNV